MRVTYSLLQKVLGTRLQKKMAVFITWKSVYENSCIYDWSYAKVARSMGVSKSKAKKYIDIFLRRGWCRLHCGHLNFRRIEEVSEIETGRRNSLIFHLEGKVEKAVHDDLFALALHLKLEQCRKRELDRAGLDPDRRDRKRAEYKGEIGGAARDLSMKTLKRVWNVQDPARIVQRLESKDKVFVRRKDRVEVKMGSKAPVDYFSRIRPSKAFRQPCNRYNVTRKFDRFRQRRKMKNVRDYTYRLVDGRPERVCITETMGKDRMEKGLMECRDIFKDFEVNPLFSSLPGSVH